MKKFFITLVVALATLSFVSCGSKASDRMYLERMRDSIQQSIDFDHEWFNELHRENDSIFEAAKQDNVILLSNGDKFLINCNQKKQAELLEEIKRNEEKLYQLDLELHKK